MKAKKPLGVVLVVLGVALMVSALLLLQYNREEDTYAGLASGIALNTLQNAIGQNAPSNLELDSGSSIETLSPTDPTGEGEVPPLPTLTMDDHDYVGYLEIPELKRNLPVMKIVYLEDLQTAPCLELGSPYSDDAVISAHNYPSHFGGLKELKGGETVTFTDMKGQTIEYTVSVVKTIAPTDVDEVRNSPHDLVLYTCTPGGQNRVMVGCDRVDKTTEG